MFGGASNKGGTIELSGGNNTGSTGSGIVFKTGASTANPAQRMAIDLNGNVGIGVAPSNPLHVTSSLANGAVSFFHNSDTSNGQGILVKGGGSNSGKYIAQFQDAAANTRMQIFADGKVGIGTASPTQLIQISGNSSSSDGISYVAENTRGAGGPAGLIMKSQHGDWKMITSQTVANALEFIDGGSPDVTRVLIDSSGDFFVGKNGGHSLTTTGVGLRANGTSSFFTAGNDFIPMSIGSINDVTLTLVTFHGASATAAGSISVSSGNSIAYNTSSDYRLKTDAQPMTGASARVQALNPVNFKWISTGDRVDGFLAHEAQAVVPEAVTGTHDAMKDEEYEVTAATGDIYTPATEAYVDDDGNDVDAVNEVIHSANAEQPETFADGQQWRETTPAVMGTRSVPDYQGIDQSKMAPLLVAALQEALTEITALKARVTALETL